jgi:hypothetical protein
MGTGRDHRQIGRTLESLIIWAPKGKYESAAQFFILKELFIDNSHFGIRGFKSLKGLSLFSVVIAPLLSFINMVTLPIDNHGGKN